MLMNLEGFDNMERMMRELAAQDRLIAELREHLGIDDHHLATVLHALAVRWLDTGLIACSGTHVKHIQDVLDELEERGLVQRIADEVSH